MDVVVRIWENTTGGRLSPERRAEFTAKEEAIELAECTDAVLAAAARMAYRKHGELRLNRWLATVPRARLTMRDIASPTNGVRPESIATILPQSGWTPDQEF
jgi:hypothetical protein